MKWKMIFYVDKMKCMQVDIVIHFRGMYVQNKFSLYYAFAYIVKT